MATATATTYGHQAATGFQRASRRQSRARIALAGPSGAGKSFTGMRLLFPLAQSLCKSGEKPRIAVVASEPGAIEKYLGEVVDGFLWEFDVCTLSDYAPTTYTQFIQLAGRSGYHGLLVDSLSHAWAGEGGALELKDKKAAETRNDFTSWKDITPMQHRMVESILRSPCHVVTTMRTKTEYVIEENDKGKKVPRKIGLSPIQRQGIEYEFDLFADIDLSHTLTVSKTRCRALDGEIVVKAGATFIEPFVRWCMEGLPPDPDYFCVTEAELERHERAQRQAEMASMSRADKLKAGAASQVSQANGQANGNAAAQMPQQPAGNGQAAQSPPATNTQAAAPASAAEPLTTPDQLAEFQRLLPLCFDSMAEFKSVLVPYNVTRASELTARAADGLLSAMNRRAADRKAAAAKANLAATATGDVTGSAAAAPSAAVPSTAAEAPAAEPAPKKPRGRRKKADAAAADPAPAESNLSATVAAPTSTTSPPAESATGTAAAAPAAPAFDPSKPGTITADQLGILRKTIESLLWPKDGAGGQREYLANLGYETFRSLSANQADFLIEKLRRIEFGVDPRPAGWSQTPAAESSPPATIPFSSAISTPDDALPKN